MFSFFKTKQQKLVEKAEEEKAAKRKAQEDERTAREQEFKEKLEELPTACIIVSETKAKHNTLNSMPDYSYSNITKNTKTDNLGNYVTIDVETTGLQPTRHEIVEVSAVRFRDWKPVEKFSTLCAPRKGIDPGAERINNITTEMVTGKPAFDEIASSLQDFIGNDSLIGHNLEFDIRFLWHYGLDCFQKKRKYYDTLDLAERTLKRIKKKYNKEWGYYEDDFDSDFDVYDYRLGDPGKVCVIDWN